ncbi:MAG: ATP-binding cassette domain-containing protein, partial [Actinomycetota bacterium]
MATTEATMKEDAEPGSIFGVHIEVGSQAEQNVPEGREVVFRLEQVSVAYDGMDAVRGVTMDVPANQITAIIGPSGCGKSTLIRTFNRMNDLIPSARVGGKVLYHGQDLYGPAVDPVQVRRRIGMVFQKPNPFPKSIFDNV